MSQLNEVVSDSFIRYAGNVILDRAICDVRDLLKPSARMLMYSQLYITKNTPNKPFVKSARVVGDCLGRYYTHGDGSCYATYMRMAKPFAMRYPLEDCQGNCGTITETNDEGHMRYTELRLSNLCSYLFKDIDKNTINDWNDNFDETEQYPKILPSKGFYNIVNGSTGIGVSLSASIPQFNIKEINNALINLIDNPDYEVDILPDFATGGLLMNPNEVRQCLKNGHGGSCQLRSVIEFDPTEYAFIVKEIPYGVYTKTISEEISALNDANPNCGINRISDGSGKTPDYMIFLDKKANPNKVLNLLYKNTSLQSNFTINMNVLVDNGRVPKTLSLKEMLQEHIKHEREIYKRGFEFDLHKIENRIHIINGLLICLANISEVVKTIKESESTALASVELQKRFLLDEVQAKAILEMKLSRLAHLEVEKLKDELASLKEESQRIANILADDELFKNEIKNGWREVIDKFGDERRTKVIYGYQEESEPEEIEEKNIIVHLLNNNNIFLQEEIEDSGKRGSKGKKIGLPKNAEVIKSITTTSTSSLTFFTEDAKFYSYNLAEAEFNTTTYLPNSSRAILMVDNFALKSYDSLVTVTKNGYIKKTKVTDYLTRNSKGIAAAKVADDDKLVFAGFAKADENIIICASNGYYNYYSINDVTYTGRYTQGTRGIKLTDGAYVVSAEIEHKIDYIGLMSISSLGKGKITALSDYPKTSKAVKGNLIMTLPTDETIKAIKLIPENCEKVTAISGAKANTMWIKDIPVSGRATTGVKIIETKGDITIL